MGLCSNGEEVIVHSHQQEVFLPLFDHFHLLLQMQRGVLLRYQHILMIGLLLMAMIGGDDLVQLPILVLIFPLDHQMLCSDHVQMGITFQRLRNGVMLRIASLALYDAEYSQIIQQS